MATNYISSKLKTYLANAFKATFDQDASNRTGFIFMAKSVEYANGVANVDSISDTVYDEKSVWDNMIVAKKISPNDVELIIPRYNWEANTIYKQYDDRVDLTDLLTEANSIMPMYVWTANGNVYKCLSNNLEALSTEEPDGNYESANGVIKTVDDYVWKYMYNISQTNKFLTETWMPVPFETDSTPVQAEYGLSDTNFIDGSVDLIVVTNSGSGYVHSTIQVNGFTSGQTYLSVATTANLATNMLVSGTGILLNTYITSISNELNRVYLSYPTIATGGGANNLVDILTRVVVEGDGTGITAEAELSNTTIEKIVVVNSGSNYTKANVFIYGTGSGANARIVLPIKYGHGYAPALELGASSVFIDKTFGQDNSPEEALIPQVMSFRQYGILLDPHKYGERQNILYSEANNIVTLTTNVTLLSGLDFTVGEKVYQGTAENPTFYGYVNSQESTFVRLTNVYGVLQNGASLIGEDSGRIRTVVSGEPPELQPYTGDVLYTKNIQRIQRYFGQSEEMKFIIKF